jgi:hypothetical protein
LATTNTFIVHKAQAHLYIDAHHRTHCNVLDKKTPIFIMLGPWESGSLFFEKERKGKALVVWF